MISLTRSHAFKELGLCRMEYSRVCKQLQSFRTWAVSRGTSPTALCSPCATREIYTTTSWRDGERVELCYYRYGNTNVQVRQPYNPPSYISFSLPPPPSPLLINLLPLALTTRVEEHTGQAGVQSSWKRDLRPHTEYQDTQDHSRPTASPTHKVTHPLIHMNYVPFRITSLIEY